MPLQGFTMPPPYKGLDLVSPIDNMDPSYALELVNVFPGAGAPTVRLGYKEFCDVGIASPLLFSAPLNLKNGTTQLIVANDTNLYSISTTGVATDITNLTPHTDSEFQSTTFANNIYLANGVDHLSVYTGSGTATDTSFTFGGGVTGHDIINVSIYRRRLYMVQKDTAIVHYGNTEATGVSGTSSTNSFDFQYVFTQGGFLVACGAYTNQTANTSQDLFFALSSEGEIVFYSGTSPSDSAWTLVARYYIGKPLGYRAFIPINSDTWILTQQGIVPISALFQMSPEQAAQSISGRVNPFISDYGKLLPFDHEWTGVFWPAGRRVYVSVPTSTTTVSYLVYSLDTGGWTEFRLHDNKHGISMAVFDRLPFYASSNGIVWQGETGQLDAVTATNSESIKYSGRSAFSFFGSRANYKVFADIRPIVRTKRGISLNVGIDTDFQRAVTVTGVTTSPGTFTPWGSPWGVAPGTILPIPPYTPLTPVPALPWSSDLEYIFDRFATQGQGHSAAYRFGGSLNNASMQILGMEIRFNLGGQV